MKIKRNTIIVFFALFTISMTIQITLNNSANYYDAAGYWALGKSCGWDVRNITSEYRGWCFPIFFLCTMSWEWCSIRNFWDIGFYPR